MAKYRGKDIYLSPQINLHAIIDQEYNGESEHAQSGKAVAQALESKADKKHNHEMEDVTGLSDALAAKADNSALGNYETTEQASAAIEAAKTELQGEIDKKADLEHTHNYAGSETAGGIANYANALAGFSKTGAEQGAKWGNQDGEFITGQSRDGAEIQFRGTGEGANKALNVIIDGYFYQNLGRYKVLDETTGALKSHTHTATEITDLTETLAPYATSDELTSYATKDELSGKAESVHKHEITDVTGLQEALSAASGGGNLVVDQTYNPESTNAQSGTAVAEALTGYAVVGHTHSDYALKSELESYALKTYVNTAISEALSSIVNGNEVAY